MHIYYLTTLLLLSSYTSFSMEQFYSQNPQEQNSNMSSNIINTAQYFFNQDDTQQAERSLKSDIDQEADKDFTKFLNDNTGHLHGLSPEKISILKSLIDFKPEKRSSLPSFFCVKVRPNSQEHVKLMLIDMIRNEKLNPLAVFRAADYLTQNYLQFKDFELLKKVAAKLILEGDTHHLRNSTSLISEVITTFFGQMNMNSIDQAKLSFSSKLLLLEHAYLNKREEFKEDLLAAIADELRYTCLPKDGINKPRIVHDQWNESLELAKATHMLNLELQQEIIHKIIDLEKQDDGLLVSLSQERINTIKSVEEVLVVLRLFALRRQYQVKKLSVYEQTIFESLSSEELKNELRSLIITESQVIEAQNSVLKSIAKPIILGAASTSALAIACYYYGFPLPTINDVKNLLANTAEAVKS